MAIANHGICPSRVHGKLHGNGEKTNGIYIGPEDSLWEILQEMYIGRDEYFWY